MVNKAFVLPLREKFFYHAPGFDCREALSVVVISAGTISIIVVFVFIFA
jgi:hypothetical protein